MAGSSSSRPPWVRSVLHRGALTAERALERLRQWRDDGSPPEHLRIIAYTGHGNPGEVVVRGRVVDDPEPREAIEGEGTWAAMRRMAKRFETDELPGVRLAISCGGDDVEVTTDEEGYYDVRLHPGLPADVGDWAEATVRLAEPLRGIEPGDGVTADIRIPHEDVDVGIISDIDDTILRTGAQRMWEMVLVMATGSAVTRTAFAGVAELYRALAVGTGGPARPFAYVSSSPWNLEGFLTAFMARRDIPAGPLLLRDLGIDETKFIKSSHGDHKLTRIREVMDLHPAMDMVLVGDSGQHDPQIYAKVVAEYPGRVRAVWIREVRLDPGDGRVERVGGAFDEAAVPMVLAPDSTAFADHAVQLGLIPASAAEAVSRAVDREQSHGATSPA